MENPDKSRQTQQRNNLASEDQGEIVTPGARKLRGRPKGSKDRAPRGFIAGKIAAYSHYSGLAAATEAIRQSQIMPHVPRAIAALVSACDDPNAAIRVKAATAILDRAGLNPPKAQDTAPGSGADLGALSPEQLRRFVEAASLQLSNKARVIDSAPVVATDDSEPVDPLG